MEMFLSAIKCYNSSSKYVLETPITSKINSYRGKINHKPDENFCDIYKCPTCRTTHP